jgi:hypothetical protein
MGLFDRIGRELNRGIGAVGGFLGDVIGGAVESFSDPGFQLPTGGGFGRTLGGLAGEAGEVLLGGLIGRPEVMSGGGIPLPPTVPGGFPGLGIPLPPPIGQAHLPVPSAPMGGGVLPMQLPIPGGLTFPTTQPMEDIEMTQAVALPGGALIAPLLRGLGGAALGGAAVGGAISAFQPGAVELPFGGRVFRQTPSGIRARSLVEVMNPLTGRKTWYRNVGRPILFSGDLRSCKRVQKIASRARRARGR